MNKIIPMEHIESKIYIIRGFKIILDRDLAELYGVKPIRLREQVKRNIKRFPLDFMFQLRQDEVELMVSQNAIPSKQHLGGYLPYAFTEHGVAMLSAVLNSERAIEVNIIIIRAFVKLREMIYMHKELAQKLNQLERKHERHDEQIQAIFDQIREFMTFKEKPKKSIGFKKEDKI
jgi:hypothetical protein